MAGQPENDPFDRVVATAQALLLAKRAVQTRINVNANALMNQWRPVITQTAQNATQKLNPVGLRFYDLQSHQSGDANTNITVKAISANTDKTFGALRFGIDKLGNITVTVSQSNLPGFPKTMDDDAIDTGQVAAVMADYAEQTLIQAIGR